MRNYYMFMKIVDKCALRSEDLFERAFASEFRSKQTHLIGDFRKIYYYYLFIHSSSCLTNNSPA
jgi:hypothetical protein